MRFVLKTSREQDVEAPGEEETILAVRKRRTVESIFVDGEKQPDQILPKPSSRHHHYWLVIPYPLIKFSAFQVTSQIRLLLQTALVVLDHWIYVREH